jgi:hypothetical protein
MARDTHFPAWQADAIRSLLDISGVEARLLIVPADDSFGGTARAARLGGLLRDWRHLIWNLYNKGFIERRSRASRPVDLTEELAGVALLECRTVPSGRFGEAFEEADVDAIRGHDLDFILRFGFGIVKGPVLDVPRHGIWSFHHGDERVYRGRPPGFWELADGTHVVGAILQRLTDRLDGGVVLHRGAFRAIRHSYRRTRDSVLLGTSDWPAVVCRSIMQAGGEVARRPPSPTVAPIRRDPGNLVALRFLVAQALAFISAQWRGLASHAQWTVGVADAPISAFLAQEPPQLRWLPEHGPGRYLADPFAVARYPDVALVEDYDHARHRGVISALPLDGTGGPRPVIDPGVHASYPFLFEGDGAIWCAPETYQARELRLYRSVAFPDRWEHVATPIRDVEVLDPTFLHFEGRWWIFCTDHSDGPDTKLRIWFADGLMGPWTPHPLNPVKTDIRSSRPAGTPFLHDGALYRPSQDGSKSYGGGISIARVDVLSPVAFEEVVVTTLAPPTVGGYTKGLHTLCAVGDRTVVDGRRDVFVPAAFRREFAARLRRRRS